MSRFTMIALVLGVVGGTTIGASHETLDHVKELFTKSFSARVEIAKETGQHLECGPLATLIPGIREQQVDAATNGDSPLCSK